MSRTSSCPVHRPKVCLTHGYTFEGMNLARMWRQWKATALIWALDGFAYKAQGFIWILTDTVTGITMPLVWAAAAHGGLIAGYAAKDFVLYYMCMLFLTCFITSHFMWDISWEIKEGIFSVYLIRPMPFFQFMLVRNFTWRIIRTLIFAPMGLLLIFFYWSYLHDARLYLGWEFWVSALLGHLLSITFVMALSMIALFVQEAQSVFELYYFPMLFLSGQLFPVSMMPDWVRSLAAIFPFYYTTGVPTEVVIGKLSPAVAQQMIAVQFIWIAASYIAQRVLWKYGLRAYTAVGM